MSGNLSRVKLISNPNYTKSGIKSYVYLLHKCKQWCFFGVLCKANHSQQTDGIGPTKEGPYLCTNRIHQTGKHTLLQHAKSRAGGKAHVQQHVLQKRDTTTGETGEVPAQVRSQV